MQLFAARKVLNSEAGETIRARLKLKLKTKIIKICKGGIANWLNVLSGDAHEIVHTQKMRVSIKGM